MMTKTEKASAQTVFQLAVIVGVTQHSLGERDPGLEQQVREQIDLWGGMEEVDAWLGENDPWHSQLHHIQEIDWGFLGEN